MNLHQIIKDHMASLHSSSWGEGFSIDGGDRSDAAADFLLREWNAVNAAVRAHLGARETDALIIFPDGDIKVIGQTMRIGAGGGIVRQVRVHEMEDSRRKPAFDVT